MKTLFIPAEVTEPIDVSKVKIEGSFAIATTVQYLHQLKDIQKKLPNSIIAGQILGCNASCCKDLKVDSILFIGTGQFHPIRIAIETKKPVYVLNPATNLFHQLDPKIVEDHEKKIKAKQSQFILSDKIGIIVSTKPGQNNLKKALELKKKLNKESYIFLFNNVNELENFPDIDIWINTACSRIESKNIINLEDLPN